MKYTHHTEGEIEEVRVNRANLDPMWRDYEYHPHMNHLVMLTHEEHRRLHAQERKAAKKVRRYTSMDQVAEDFALDSPEYLAAVRMFDAQTR